MTEHIREGMSLNQQRQVVYEKLSGGRSRWVSLALINYEKLAIFYIKTFKVESKLETQAQIRGAPFLCEEFQMSPNKGRVNWQIIQPPMKSVKVNSSSILIFKLYRELSKKNLNGHYSLVLNEIKHLLKEPRLNCLYRHVLESMARVAWLGMKDPIRAELSIQLLKTMNLSLLGSRHVDYLAEPLQREGLPILCHDLPVIRYY
ncbi:MAG: hypothetical protein ACK5V3_06200 [Bdellovibrionales bacterium]